MRRCISGQVHPKRVKERAKLYDELRMLKINHG